jgi:hypothetical protein
MKHKLKKSLTEAIWLLRKFSYKFSSINRVQKKNESQVIICGFPRSGTSLLFNIIAGTLAEHTVFTGTKPRLSKEGSFKLKILDEGSFISKSPSDVFNLDKLEQWNVRNKKCTVFVCIRDMRDLLVSKHQMIPDKYYMGYEWRLIATTGKKNTIGLKHFFHQIKKLKEQKRPSFSIHFILYEELTKNPDFISDILVSQGLKVSNNATSYYKNDVLPYGSDAEISRGHEYKGVVQKAPTWKTNNDDKKHVENVMKQHPEIQYMLDYFGYTSSENK